ncbi:M3 family metallopeptidase [Gammaproteobacteria bacterium]|nr:M3 family metallopeptidase [Gammaproteobacteria bacterium]
MTDNPLLADDLLPRFDAILPQHAEPAIDAILTDCRQALSEVIGTDGDADWDNTITALSVPLDRLDRVFSPISHLHAVVNNDEWRSAYQACQSKIVDFYTDLGQSDGLYQRYLQLEQSPTFPQFDAQQRKIISDFLTELRRAGVHLAPESKARLKAINERASELSTQFSQHLLDATDAYALHITDASELDGMPPTALALAKAEAETRELDGWVFTLQMPSVIPFLSHCRRANRRLQLHQALQSRASELGDDQWDNGPLMVEALQLRQERARLLGFDDFASYKLANRMANSSTQVLDFLGNLAERSATQAKTEMVDIERFANEHGAEAVDAADVSFWAERLKEARYAFNDEELRPYFPAERVLAGMFDIAERLFGIYVEAADGALWHQTATLYRVRDGKDGETRAWFYLDPYARSQKQGGAWQGVQASRRVGVDGTQLPVAYLVCNFSPPTGDGPALLSHDEVTTLFHEFGHGLHTMLTEVDHPSHSGINRVPWDAVELPSQIMENWCWEKDGLAIIAGHVDSGEPIPSELLEKLRASRNFLSAMAMVRQLEFSLFDMRLHIGDAPQSIAEIEAKAKNVRDQVAVVPHAAYNRFPNSFAHIFAGGYSAGYYSYKWAEVLSADAFSAFEEEGIFNAETGKRFRESILAVGGIADPLEAFKNFRGREPEIDALMRHSGLAA